MKVWLVVYVLNSVSGVAGPLPYNMQECMDRADDLVASADVNFKKDPNQALKDGRTVHRDDVEVTCQLRDTKPKFGDTKNETH